MVVGKVENFRNFVRISTFRHHTSSGGIGDIDVEGCSNLFFNDRAYRVWRVSNLSCVGISQS